MLETDEEKIESNLRYMEQTGDMRPFWWTLKTLIKIKWRNFWGKKT